MVTPIRVMAEKAREATTKSFFFGSVIPIPLRVFAFSRRYHIRVSEGRVYIRIRPVSAVRENSRTSPYALPAGIREKRTQ
jgi:hypothetical protein